jgi:hypothetical protein
MTMQLLLAESNHSSDFKFNGTMNPVVKYFSQERSGSMLFITAGVIASAIALYFFFGF